MDPELLALLRLLGDILSTPHQATPIMVSKKRVTKTFAKYGVHKAQRTVVKYVVTWLSRLGIDARVEGRVIAIYSDEKRLEYAYRVLLRAVTGLVANEH